MNDLVLGINETDLENLSLEVLDYVDRITEIFDKIDNCMSRLSSSYSDCSCDSIMDYYNFLSSYYSVIKNNLISYSDDFVCLIRKMEENDKYILTLFETYTDEAKKKSNNLLIGR